MPQPIHKVEHSLSQQVVALYQNHQQLHAPQSHHTHLQLQSDNHCLQGSGSLPSLHPGCDTHSRNGSFEARREVFDGLGGQEVERKKTLRHCRMMQ